MSWIRDFRFGISSNYGRQISFVCRTKLELVTRQIVRSLWSCHHVDWLFLGSVRAFVGILIMWDKRTVEKLDQAVGHFSVSCKFQNLVNQSVWTFSGVYGPHVDNERRLMWDELSGVHHWWEVPWCVGGDFNVVRFPSERLGAAGYTSSMLDFSNFISANGLVDIPMEGGCLHLV